MLRDGPGPITCQVSALVSARIDRDPEESNRLTEITLCTTAAFQSLFFSWPSAAIDVAERSCAISCDLYLCSSQAG